MTDGTLEQVGTRWRLRFRRDLPYPPERVWRAITDPDELAAWFPHRIDGTWTVGASLTFRDSTDATGSFTGEVLRVDPHRLLEYTWGTDVLRFEILPTEAGCTLTLMDTFSEHGKAARDAAGWHVCLDSLTAVLAGTESGSDQMQRWHAVHPGYVDAFGPDAATIGPPSS